MLVNDVVKGIIINIGFIQILFMIIATKKKNDELNKKYSKIRDACDEIIEELLERLRERN